MELNKIYKGDSLELLKKLNGNSVDLVITSPPYSTLKTYISDTGIPADDYVDWFLPYCKEIERVIKPKGSFILNINDKVDNGFRHPYVFDLISRLHKETNLKMFERLFWNKMKGLPNRSRFGDRVEFIFWFAKEKGFYFNIDEMRTPYSQKSIQRMKNPLKKRMGLLFPNKLILAFLNIATLITTEIIQRKNTTSMAGMLLKYLTPRFIMEKNIPATNMCCTPLENMLQK
jgi:DNA modification methylase